MRERIALALILGLIVAYPVYGKDVTTVAQDLKTGTTIGGTNPVTAASDAAAAAATAQASADGAQTAYNGLPTHTSSASYPVDVTNPCIAGDRWSVTNANPLLSDHGWCSDAAADEWSFVKRDQYECETFPLISTDTLLPGKPFAITIRYLRAIAIGSSPNETVALEECDNAAASCSGAGGISVTADGGVDTDTTFSDAAFDADDAWNINFTVNSGSVTYTTVEVCYTR